MSGVEYATKLLSPATWADFEELFSRGNGWDFCACMVFHRGHHLSRVDYPTREQAKRQNRAEKHQLVLEDSTHGILVYANGQPVGWCQYGPAAELPGIEMSRLLGQGYTPDDITTSQRLWRITCFVVDKDHRRRNVSKVALHAALQAIGDAGGGIVDALPVTDARASAAHGGYVSTFEEAGFERVRSLAGTTVLMRRQV